MLRMPITAGRADHAVRLLQTQLEMLRVELQKLRLDMTGVIAAGL
jgi:hypothetical protein